MPAKGRYFLNEGAEGPDQAALYEKHRLTSQHGPLLLMLLAVAGAACVALVAITFSHGVSPGVARSLGFRSELGRGSRGLGPVVIFSKPRSCCVKC